MSCTQSNNAVFRLVLKLKSLRLPASSYLCLPPEPDFSSFHKMSYLPKCSPPQTKEEVIVFIEKFSTKWRRLDEFSHGVEVASRDDLHLEVLHQLSRRGEDAMEMAASEIENEHQSHSEEERQKFESIATKICDSEDVLMLITPAVEEFYNELVCPTPFAAHLWFYLYRDCGWTVVGLEGFEGCVQIQRDHAILLVRNLDSDDLSRLNDCCLQNGTVLDDVNFRTPYLEFTVNPLDTAEVSWREWMSTPHSEPDQDLEWTETFPIAANSNFRRLLERVDDMFAYKNSLVKRLQEKASQQVDQDREVKRLERELERKDREIQQLRGRILELEGESRTGP